MKSRIIVLIDDTSTTLFPHRSTETKKDREKRFKAIFDWEFGLVGGWELDLKKEMVFRDFDSDFQFNEGDRISVRPLGFAIVVMKWFDFEKDRFEYTLKEE